MSYFDNPTKPGLPPPHSCNASVFKVGDVVKGSRVYANRRATSGGMDESGLFEEIKGDEYGVL